jgi:hypothetical protein
MEVAESAVDSGVGSRGCGGDGRMCIAQKPFARQNISTLLALLNEGETSEPAVRCNGIAVLGELGEA